MPTPAAFGLSGFEASQSLFGANVLATRSDLQQGGDYDRLIDAMGVGSFRYPGGSLTERYFDIANPNARVVHDRDTGEARDFIPLNEALAYAAQEDLSVTIVIPTRDLLSTATDANGNRFAEIDEDLLRGFVSDVVTGVHGPAQIDGFEIGNEYWGSGMMSSVEYGRLASEMSVIINDELDAQGSDADIIVQSGTNFNFARLSVEFDSSQSADAVLAELNEDYGLNLGSEALTNSGDVNWTHVANEMILSEFDTAAEREAVDAVSAHVYSKAQVPGGQRDFYLDQTDEDWGAVIPDADIIVTEWNTSGSSASMDRSDDYGLFQAHEILNIVEEFMAHGVEAAHVWPLLQNTANTMSYDDGETELTAAGEMFNWMQSALPGKTAIDLADDNGRETELTEGGVSVHGFWEPNDLVFFIAAGEEGAETQVDFSGLVADTGTTTVSVLSVMDGENPGTSRSETELSEIDPSGVLDETMLTIELGAGEIMQVRMQDFTPSREFQDVISDDAPEMLPDPLVDSESAQSIEDLIPTVSVSEFEDATLTDDEGEMDVASDDGAMSGLGDVLLALPLLFLLAALG